MMSLLRLQIVEEEPDALQVLRRLHVLEQVGHAADDQRARLAAAPDQVARPAAITLLGQPSSSRAALVALPLELAARLGKRAAAEMRVEIVRRLDQRRVGRPRRDRR